MPAIIDELQRKIINRQVWLQGYNKRLTAEENKILRDRIIPEFNKFLERHIRRFESRDSQARIQLLKSFFDDYALLYGVEVNEILNQLVDLVIQESKWITSTINETTDYTYSWSIPSAERLKSITRENLFEGLKFKEQIRNLDNQLKNRLQGLISNGILTGLNSRDLEDIADEELRSSINRIEILIRTTTNNLSNNTRQLIYNKNKKIISKVKYIATLDSRTTLTCASLDNRVFPIDSGPRPPQHYGCRSTIVPVLDFSRDTDAPESLRDSVSGQVPADLSYNQWLKSQTVRVQDKVLGRRRAILFRAGKKTINNFVDKYFQPLTLQELGI